MDEELPTKSRRANSFSIESLLNDDRNKGGQCSGGGVEDCEETCPDEGCEGRLSFEGGVGRSPTGCAVQEETATKGSSSFGSGSFGRSFAEGESARNTAFVVSL